MMKGHNKTTQLALGALVVLIWGLVAYRFKNLSKGEDEVVTGVNYEVPSTSVPPTQEALQLSLNYPDPFRPSPTIQRKGPTRVITSTTTNRQAVVTTATPPGVYYKGYSKDGIGNIRARLVVNGRGITMKAGDTFGKLELLSVSEEAVDIKWEGQSIKLQRQKRK